MTKFDDWVGRHFIVGLRPTPELSDEDVALLSAVRPAGVILYKSNFDHDAPYELWTEKLRKLLDDVRSVIGRDGLIVGIDHEGAKVCRTPQPITRFSYPAHWASSAGAVGKAMGRELASLGVNLNFAPLLDIASNPDNPVIGERAFAQEPEAVGEAALAFMAGMEAEGVAACGKHFPGHGDTNLDSHFALPVLDLPVETLRSRELVPFRRAIEGGLGSIMTSHIMFPRIDPECPATLSPKIIDGLLRRELGFDGLVMSDDVGMHAMDAFFDRPTAAASFLAAGNDMLMVCAHWTDTERARGFATAIVEARKAGELPDGLLEASSTRIERFMGGLSRNAVRTLPDELFAEHAAMGAQFGGETVEVI